MNLKERRERILQEAVKRGVKAVGPDIVSLAEDAATVCSRNKGFFNRVKAILSSSQGKPDNSELITLLQDSGDAIDNEYKDSSERDWELL